MFSVNLARAAGVGEIAGSDQSFQCACNGAAGEQLLVVLSTAAGLGAVGQAGGFGNFFNFGRPA